MQRRGPNLETAAAKGLVLFREKLAERDLRGETGRPLVLWMKKTEAQRGFVITQSGCIPPLPGPFAGLPSLLLPILAHPLTNLSHHTAKTPARPQGEATWRKMKPLANSLSWAASQQPATAGQPREWASRCHVGQRGDVPTSPCPSGRILSKQMMVFKLLCFRSFAAEQ